MPATLSTAEIAQDVFDAFRVRFPMLFSAISTDFTSGSAKLGQQVISRIPTIPTVRDYDATTGYEANAADSNDLMTDVTVTIDQHKHVPVKVDYLNTLSTNRNLYQESIMNMAYALGKTVLDYLLGLSLIENFSEQTIETIANTDRDTLGKVRKAMNAAKASPTGRFGIVNSDFAEALEIDPRIASGDYYGQRTEADGYVHYQNLVGFKHIWEYPDFPANAENQTAFFGTPQSFILATRVPKDQFELAAAMGIPSTAKTKIHKDLESGLTLMEIAWMKSGPFDIYVTFVLLFGAKAGSQGGAAGDLLDYSGHRVLTANPA